MPIYTPQFDAYQTRLVQLIDGLEHVYKFYHLPGNFAEPPGEDPDTYEVVNALPASVGWETAMEAFLDVFKSQFTDESTFTTCELWKVETDTLDFQFLSAFTPVAQPTAAEVAVPANVSIFTARTAGGNILRITAIEGRTTGNTVLPWVAVNGGTSAQQLAWDVCNDATKFIVDRYGTFPFSSLKQNRGQNEAVWRKRFRP